MNLYVSIGHVVFIPLIVILAMDKRATAVLVL